MPEYTQEQLDAMVTERLAEATKGMFTQEEFEKKLLAETDRRVNSGIQKGLETQKAKWEQEFAERAKLSAEELAKKEFEEKLSTLTAKERDLAKKENELLAKNMFVSNNIPESKYQKIIGKLVTDDSEMTKSSVQDFIDMFNETKTELETKIKSEASQVPPPKTKIGDGVVSKEAFDKMGYAEKMAFKISNPDLFKEFTK